MKGDSRPVFVTGTALENLAQTDGLLQDSENSLSFDHPLTSKSRLHTKLTRSHFILDGNTHLESLRSEDHGVRSEKGLRVHSPETELPHVGVESVFLYEFRSSRDPSHKDEPPFAKPPVRSETEFVDSGTNGKLGTTSRRLQMLHFLEP